VIDSPRPPPSRFVVFLALGLLVGGCGEQRDWSPWEEGWDPTDPRAAEVLAAPAPGSPVDEEMAAAGERWYRTRGCLACHPIEGAGVVGPALGGVTRRRDYDWFRGMVMRPDSMLREDPVARELLEIWRVPMPNQGVDELRTRAMWEYLRREDLER
jgi:mono/diheme cytochrome c family protein